MKSREYFASGLMIDGRRLSSRHRSTLLVDCIHCASKNHAKSSATRASPMRASDRDKQLAVTVILFVRAPAWRDRDITPSSLRLVIRLSGELRTLSALISSS